MSNHKVELIWEVTYTDYHPKNWPETAFPADGGYMELKMRQTEWVSEDGDHDMSKWGVVEIGYT